MLFKKIAVVGLGKVGGLAAQLLQQSGFDVIGLDMHPGKPSLTFPVFTVDVSNLENLKQQLEGSEAILSCLPYHLNLDLAKFCHSNGLHYFDLTEDVAITKEILSLSKTASAVMVPQCGLAPGFIGIVGSHLVNQFETVRSLKLRVGALPQNPTGLLAYAFNWSPEGVVNEYLNDCEVIEEGLHKWVSAMEWLETIYIKGVQLEAFTTSGGLGTMCQTYLNKIDNLDYKTMRYPGHVSLMNFFFHELLLRENRELAGKILTHAKPPVNDDVVYVHAAAEGLVNDRLKRQEFVEAYYPKQIAGKMRTAISWTTSASACAVIELVNRGELPERGCIKQEEIPLQSLLNTHSGSYYKKLEN
ncbi:MAG: L-lysine dehydrogenase [Gammaproteobacteria bacterium]|nr:L-lysine dehydrogenase [Gammaproteobacteria bacterium]